jgi:phosphoribosylaminoimidazole carboxylase PurE protein
MKDASVLIVMGSISDLDVMREAEKTLSSLGIPSTMRVASAHRTPELVEEIIREFEKQNGCVIIAGAGYAAHLAGVIASKTTLPVIGVPLSSSDLSGLDALLSTVQMPPGIPVATVGIGSAGAKNAALLAGSILGLASTEIREKIQAFRTEMADKVKKDDQKLRKP